MKKMIASVLMLGLVGAIPPAVSAGEDAERVGAVVGAAGWATYIGSTARMGATSSGYLAEANFMTLIAWAIANGAYISYATDPERTGRGYRLNGHAGGVKFENDPDRPGWKRLKAYADSGPGYIEPVRTVVYKKWAKPDGYGFMQKAS